MNRRIVQDARALMPSPGKHIIGRRALTRSLFGAALSFGLAVSSGTIAPTTAQAAPQVQGHQLEVMSWWTSASESQALAVLRDAFRVGHPDVTFANGNVSGGGGQNIQVVLSRRLAEGAPPDIWQTFPGAALRAWSARESLSDLSALYTAQAPGASMPFGQSLPKAVLDAVTIDGRQQAVPTGAHRSNTLFFNRELLRRAGVAAPDQDYSVERFEADLRKLKAAGVSPLCLGGKDTFARAELFESALLARAGADGWQRIASDRFDWNGNEAREAMRLYGLLLDNADPKADESTWDEAAERLANGDCALLSFNDSAYGELVRRGKSEERDFGVVAWPGTARWFLGIFDSFVASARSKNLDEAVAFLGTMTVPSVSADFNRVKGSIPLRQDIDMSAFPPWQRESARVLRQGQVLMSITHGEAADPAFQQGFFEAVKAYGSSRSPRTFADSLARAVNSRAMLMPR